MFSHHANVIQPFLFKYQKLTKTSNCSVAKANLPA